MKLNTDHVDIEATPDGIMLQPNYVSFLQSQGYNLDAVTDVRIVPSSSRDIAHLVMQIQTTDKPPGHPESDVVADKTVISCCSCESFLYQQSIDVSKKTLAEGNMGRCKHLIGEYREEKAKADKDQERLI